MTPWRRSAYHRGVLTTLELTKRRAVDLCRVAACLCRLT